MVLPEFRLDAEAKPLVVEGFSLDPFFRSHYKSAPRLRRNSNRQTQSQATQEYTKRLGTRNCDEFATGCFAFFGVPM
jgi:hypothetical protein